MTAGTDGINAKSAADADGAVFQAATQSNDNSATATFEGAQADINVTAGDGEEDDPEQIPEDATVQVTQVDGPDIGIQGQAVGHKGIVVTDRRGLVRPGRVKFADTSRSASRRGRCIGLTRRRLTCRRGIGVLAGGYAQQHHDEQREPQTSFHGRSSCNNGCEQTGETVCW